MMEVLIPLVLMAAMYLFNFGVLLAPVVMMSDSPNPPWWVTVFQSVLISYIIFSPIAVPVYAFMHTSYFDALAEINQRGIRWLFWSSIAVALCSVMFRLIRSSNVR